MTTSDSPGGTTNTLGRIENHPTEGANRSIVNKIIDQIVADLCSGVYQKLERLPPEHELAKLFDVSRNSIREAFQILSYVGIVDIRRGDGTYFTELDGSTLLAGTNMLSLLANGDTALEALEARRVLESLFTSYITA